MYSSKQPPKRMSEPPFLSLVGLSCIVLLAGCATGGSKDKYTSWRISSTPFEKRPTLYAQLEKDGSVTPAKHQQLLAQWEAQKPVWEREQKQKAAKLIAEQKENEARLREEEQRARYLASLSPEQRHDLELRERVAEADARVVEAQQRVENAKMALDGIHEQQAAIQAALDAFPRQKSYNSTITPPLYPGGPATIHTEETDY